MAVALDRPACSPRHAKEAAEQRLGGRSRQARTTIPGASAAGSRSGHGLEPETSLRFGLWWMRWVPRPFHRRCLTAFVRQTDSRSIPACTSASSRNAPPGRRGGRLAKSSRPPGYSPTSMTSPSGLPSSKTVWVAPGARAHRCSRDRVTLGRRERSRRASGTPALVVSGRMLGLLPALRRSITRASGPPIPRLAQRRTHSVASVRFSGSAAL
jgi:hypothetical protein